MGLAAASAEEYEGEPDDAVLALRARRQVRDSAHLQQSACSSSAYSSTAPTD